MCVNPEGDGEAGTQRRMQTKDGKGVGDDGASKEVEEESRRIRRTKNEMEEDEEVRRKRKSRGKRPNPPNLVLI